LFLENTESVQEYACGLFHDTYEHYPVLQVFMSGFTPVGLKAMTETELGWIGWKRTRRVRGGVINGEKPSPQKTLRMIGHVDGIWTGPDDPDCEVYLEKLLDARKRKEPKDGAQTTGREVIRPYHLRISNSLFMRILVQDWVKGVIRIRW
jgi:hypothetical protein